MAFSAFLDACVLVPINLTDVLLRLAEADTFRPLWSAEVLDEVERNLPKVGVTSERARRRVEVMRAAFPDAEVTGYESLVPTMTTDPGDRHVLAAAVRGGAAIIVTANTRHFPAAALAPYNVEAVHPDDFLLDQLDLYPGQTIQCLCDLVRARQRPPETLDSFLAQLVKMVPKFSAAAAHQAALRHLAAGEVRPPARG
jgi:predicted nucleic acid-binding protein